MPGFWFGYFITKHCTKSTIRCAAPHPEIPPIQSIPLIASCNSRLRPCFFRSERKDKKMVGARWTEFVTILVFIPKILSAPQTREDSIQDQQVGSSFTFILRNLFGMTNSKTTTMHSLPWSQQVECVGFEEAGFYCVPSDHCSQSGVIKANFSEQFQPRYWWHQIFTSARLSLEEFFIWPTIYLWSLNIPPCMYKRLQVKTLAHFQ